MRMVGRIVSTIMMVNDIYLLEFLAMPKMYFHVASQDTWGRYRTEGYTYLDIPTFPGRILVMD